MPRSTTQKLLAGASLVAAVGLPISVWAQDAAPAAPILAPAQPAPQPPPGEGPVPTQPATVQAVAPVVQPAPTPASQPVPTDKAPVPIGFNFKDTKLDQVLDFFARESGVPIIFEAPVPPATLTFVSASKYTFDEALSILNLNLARHGVHLRRQDQYLYLATLQDTMKRATAAPSDLAAIDALTPDQVVTVSIPLDNARADQIAEQVKTMIGPFGGVVAIPAQNLLVVVESVGQIKRIREVVESIDSRKPADAAFRLFTLQHSQCDAVLSALKGLVAERSKTVIVDKDGSQRVVQDQNTQGLNLVAEPRTNSIVAVGPEAKIKLVDEVIQLLDVPEGGGADGTAELRTFTLVNVTPDEAARQVTALFTTLDAKRRPNILPLATAGKITIVGAKAHVVQAALLLAEIDPGVGIGAERQAAAERRASVVRVQHVQPGAMEQLISRLVTPRQQQMVRFAATPDGAGLVVMGPDADVAAVEKLIASMDVPSEQGKQVRVARINGSDPEATLKRAQELYASTGKAEKHPVLATLYAESGAAMLVGSTEGVAAFEQVLSSVQSATALNREVRLIELRQAKAADVAATLRDLAKSSQTLIAGAGPEPLFEVIESTNQLLVGGTPAQLAILDPLARNLDSRQSAERPPLRMLRLTTTDAANLAAILQKSFDGRPQEVRAKMPVTIEADAATNTLIVSAHPDAFIEIEQTVEKLNEAQAADKDGREIRIFPLKVARAEELAQTIDQMYPEQPVPLDPRTRQPRPDLKPPREVIVRADRQTNSLIVDAPAKRLAGFEQLVKSLDQTKLADNVVLRTFRVERADLNQLATTIRSLAAGGSLGAKSTTAPVTVSTDTPTRTLIVSGPQEIFAGVEDVLKKLDGSFAPPATDMKLYALVSARADRISPLVERVLTTRTREMYAQQGKALPEGERLVEVTPEPASNTIIVSAPAQVLAIADGIIKALDQQSVASATEVRVFRLTKGEAAGVSNAVTSALKAQDKPGATPAAVTPEPASNTIVIVGTSEQLERAAKLVEEMDTSVDREGLGVKTIPLKHARAESLAPVLEQVLSRESSIDRLPDWLRAQTLARGGAEQPRVKVAAETRLNAIIVSGPRSVIELAEQMVAGLDTASDGNAASNAVRVITLQNADAAQLAQNLEAVFKDGASQEPAPTIRVDPQSNSLIVRATPTQMVAVDDLTKKLDAASLNVSRQMRMVPVDRSRADAELMAQTLKRLLEQQGGVKVEVISTEELLRRTKSQDEAPKKSSSADSLSEDRGVRRRGLSLPEFAAISAAVAFQDSTPSAPPPASTPPADEAPVTIAVDKATNSIMVVGSPRMTDRLVQIAGELERQMPAEPAGVRIVTLSPNADIDGITAMVRQTVQQIGRSGPANPGGFSGPVSIFNDPAGTSLIVVSNETDFATVGSLIATFSQTSSVGKISVKVYPLTSIPAPRAIQSVQDLFSAQPRGAQARRVREMELSIAGPDGPISGRVDPSTVRMTSDPGGAAVIVAAPEEAMALIDRLIETIDQSPVQDRLAIRRYDLKNARATELSRTLQALFDAQRQGNAVDLPAARFVADDRTNTMLVTASDPQHRDIARLLEQADAKLDQDDLEVAIITLQQAAPSTVERIVEEVLVGRDPGKKDRIRISAQDGSSLFVVRAPKDDLARVREIVAQVDQAETGGLPIRSIKLERADAQQVAQALQRFFQDRANISSRPGQRVTNRVAVVGDKRTGTLIVSAGDDDFAQVQELTKTFDTPTASQDLIFKVVQLKHARVGEISETIKTVVDELRWESSWGGGFIWGQRQDENRVQVFLEPNERTNSIVIIGRGEAIATAEKVIQTLDVPDEGRAAMAIRSVRVKSADVQALRTVLQRAFQTPGWRSWRGPDPEAVTVEIDRAQRAVILVGKAERVKQAAEYIAQLDSGPEGGDQKIEAITLEHARADRAANSLRQFFTDRARAQGVDQGGVSIIGSADGNVIIASADADNMKVLRDLVSQIDQPDGGKDRRIDVIVLQNGVANDVANSLRAMFARDTRGDERVIITPQPSTNSVIVSAPQNTFGDVLALLKQLDAAPKAEEANIETVALTSARAQDVAQALRTALPPNVKVTVTPVVRSNSLMLTGSKEAIAIVMEQIRKIDTEPVRSGLIFRRFRLASAEATDVSYTIEQLLRARPKSPNESGASIDYSRADNTVTVYAPADQIEEIEKIIRELDAAPTEERTTEFVKLEFANATQAANALKVFYGRYAPEAGTPGARNVTILPDALSNSLVIRADKAQWEGIRALLTKLDTKEYDTTRQLAVIPLEHADAASVARALNEGLRAPLDEQLRRAQIQNARQRQGQPQRPGDDRPEATVLVDAEGVPTVAAEPQTNSLVVFAGGKELDRIREIIKQLDVSGFSDLPKPRIIAIKNGRPSLVANTIRELFLNKLERVGGPRSVLVIGDDTSGALIVRADDEKFAQVKALAETLEQQGEIGRVAPHVVRLKNIAAGRIRQTILATFTETAKTQGETLAVEIDRASNSLVIACSPRLLEEIRQVINELDQPAFGTTPEPGVVGLIGQNVTIVDITNNDPGAIRKILEDMGVTRPQQADRPGVVSEPVIIVPMSSRRAIAIVGAPGDGRAIESLVKSLDAAPVDAQQQVMVIPLKAASATTLATTLNSMLRVDDPATGLTGPAKALAEQIRRLQLVKAGVDQPPGLVDLSKPIRVLADAESNSIVLASTQANIDALRDVIKVLDTLPIGDAVVLRIFPLENASAGRVQTVVQQLFQQGEALRRLPGTRRQGLPPTATGQALAGEIAIAVDERTNTLIAAGREEAVALVEVLLRDLDGDRISKWVEPEVIQLKHADAATLARKLNEILVRGLSTSPEAVGLQRQFGRLRIAQQNPGAAVPAPAPIATPNGAVDAAKPAGPAMIEADLFAPITGMVISAEEQMNALLVIGTPANNSVVRALVDQLDVEAASAANTVRIFPLKFAAAERVSSVLRDIFRQRSEGDLDRPEDRLIITTDVRTNALIVSTSGKSFAIVEGLLKTLDGEQSNFSVGLHVIPVSNTDVRQLAPRVERLMRERIQAASQVGSVRNSLDAFSIEAEPTSNLLIVACSDENLGVVKELVAALTADAEKLAQGERVDIIQLGRARAAEMAQSLEQLYVEKENQRRGQNAVKVVPNERLNALIVNGTENDLIELRAMAKKLDSAELAQKQQIKWIELRSANAGEVVRLIQNVLAGRPVGGGSGIGARQATRLQFLREKLRESMTGPEGHHATEADIDGAIKDQVTLNADPRTNSIWITAPETMVNLISEMITDIEKSSAGARKIEKFRLVNADAVRMRDLLRDIFNLRQQGDAFVLVPNANAPASAGADAQGLADSSVSPVPDERMALAIAVDDRTNTLIVSGTPEYLELVRKVVDELDSIVANDRERRVYQLRNAKAKEIETTLKSYFQGEADKERLTLGTDRVGSLMKQLEEEVTVVGDESSNKLVISTSPRYMQSVLKIVEELDQTPPQVMIQVLLAEVSVDSSEQWGMDIRVGPFGGDGTVIGSAAQGVGVATALGVPNLSVTSADFGVLIRALELQGKLEILSNPQVLANNNKTAEIKVVDDIGLAGDTQRTSSFDAIVSTVERQDVGIILKVTPSISSDGFVRMEISPEISALTQRTTQINRDQTAPIISKRTVETVVTVKDGQSVVIGGLIASTDEQRRSTVPILGEIPILGLPFRTKQSEMRKTELLVVLTPRVIPTDGNGNDDVVRNVTEQAVDRLEDPSRVQDFLERIRLEVQQQKAKHGYSAPPPPKDQPPTLPGDVIPFTVPPESEGVVTPPPQDPPPNTPESKSTPPR